MAKAILVLTILGFQDLNKEQFFWINTWYIIYIFEIHNEIDKSFKFCTNELLINKKIKITQVKLSLQHPEKLTSDGI